LKSINNHTLTEDGTQMTKHLQTF